MLPPSCSPSGLEQSRSNYSHSDYEQKEEYLSTRATTVFRSCTVLPQVHDICPADQPPKKSFLKAKVWIALRTASKRRAEQTSLYS